jgi:hypothetical protein
MRLSREETRGKVERICEEIRIRRGRRAKKKGEGVRRRMASFNISVCRVDDELKEWNWDGRIDGWMASRAKVGHFELTWNVQRAQRDGCSVVGFVRHIHDTTEDEKQEQFRRPSHVPFLSRIYIVSSSTSRFSSRLVPPRRSDSPSGGHMPSPGWPPPAPPHPLRSRKHNEHDRAKS